MFNVVSFICCMWMFSGVASLEMSLDISLQASSSSREVCGFLTCKESNVSGESLDATTTITSMRLFRTLQTSLREGNVRTGSGDLVAALTLQKPRVISVSNGVKVTGLLEEDQATLSLEMVRETDCLAKYTCEVRTVDSQGRELVRTNRLGQGRKKTGGSHQESGLMRQGSSLQTLLLLQQLDNQLATLGSSLDTRFAALENRLEDKILSVHNNVQALKSELVDKIESRVVDKLYQLDTKLPICVDGRVVEVGHGGRSSSLEALLTLEQENKDEVENLTQAVEEVFLSSKRQYERIHGDIERLESKMSDRSLETLTAVRDVFSRVNATIESHLQSHMESIFSPEACRRGMATAQTLGSFPYPVVRPSGTVGLDIPYLCDTATDGGGWIVIQRRTSGNVDFYRDWNSYKKGFGSLDGDFWLGNENIYLLSSSDQYELRIEMRYQNRSVYAHYNSFSVASEKEGYALSLGEYDGTAGDSLTYHDGKKFSTYDIAGGNCAVTYKGAWWYDNCHKVNLNGLWGAGSYKGPRWDKLSAEKPVSFSEIKIRRL